MSPSACARCQGVPIASNKLPIALIIIVIDSEPEPSLSMPTTIARPKAILLSAHVWCRNNGAIVVASYPENRQADADVTIIPIVNRWSKIIRLGLVGIWLGTLFRCTHSHAYTHGHCLAYALYWSSLDVCVCVAALIERTTKCIHTHARRSRSLTHGH